MSEIQNAVTILGGMTGLENKEVISTIMEWNKDKVYPVSVIDIQVTASGVVDNSKDIGELVDKIEVFVEEIAKNALDTDSVQEAKKTVSEIGKYLTETRKIQTNPLKDVVGHYTEHENRFSGFSSKLNDKIDAINEKTYQKNEKALRDYFDELLKSKELVELVSMEAFVDFIENKRKTKVLTEATGKLTKGAKDAIDKAIDAVARPILESKALDEKKALQSKQFESYLDGITSDGKSEVLEANIKSLMKLRESVPELYPDVIESCYRSIDNKIARCESNIKSNQAIADKEALENADGELMAKYEEIKSTSRDMTLHVKELEDLYSQLIEIHNGLTFAENQKKVGELGASLRKRAEEIKGHLKASVYTPKTETKREPTEDIQENASYALDMEDLEVLAGIEVSAPSEEEAKAELVRRFAMHLDMIDLIKKDK